MTAIKAVKTPPVSITAKYIRVMCLGYDQDDGVLVTFREEGEPDVDVVLKWRSRRTRSV